MRLTLRNGACVILGVGASLSVLWYGFYPHEVHLEYIGFTDTGGDGEYWNQYTSFGVGMLQEVEAADLPDVGFSKDYLIASRNREIDRMTYVRVSRFLWPYGESYQEKVVSGARMCREGCICTEVLESVART